MPDILRLQVVYETQGAVAGAQRLTRATSDATREMNRGSTAAIHLAQGLAEGNVSAVTLARSIEHLGGGIGALATGLGLAAAAFVLWSNWTEKQAKLTEALRKEVEASQLALNALLGIEETSTEQQIRRLKDRIKELQDQINQPNWWEKLMALWNTPTMAGDRFGIQTRQQRGGAALGEFQFDPKISTVAKLEKQLDILERLSRGQRAAALGGAPGFGLGGLSFNPSGPAGAAFNRPISFGGGPSGPGFRGGTLGVDTSGLAFHPSVPDALDEGLSNITRQQERIVESWTAGLDVMQESLEDFLVTGKFVFSQLVDDLLRIAFRAATDQFVEKAVQGVFSAATHSTPFRRAITKP